ncbi:MAG: hypothetical protein UU51_C0014G0011 [Microgenomates group bacterium GW2011_GWC1_41_20]|uniref:Glycosyltransferase RgtA/B/C/D-like domain-containing protein n=6 Tax=Candidatus Woeseibacteriota TaxID=1752722 RepID=A0A0G0RRC0_9BACT|nr:MAG: hypothetical protein UT76_C0007G0008 [Candidatus Woesebacteria bacterium GW2011_GWB1_40_12]KKR55204.1 MAG: hypothetical protein UT93_C0026G0004 [Candidatus Woesebacteria bacterium GW2011_GWF1_40_24]KKR90855.1 MAG: hypothetical protein UU39_C0006G0010 [Candidatus Woesebacteria bacterium GW2011_GWD1_41_12]KKS00248.1 MAG: hypothetical protein UU51_C0014G0011 [Microgenomates group bacterium GW2011_GWC1_41_20]KKS03753.1 MAG: hypothetical protein UU57_C0030G0002 [Candidatus Woesebacteria bact
MKHLKIKSIWESLKRFLPIIFITALAVFLRFYLLEKRISFDADQEEIAFKAKEVLSGNPVLLGPKTSLGGFSIGPGFTYLWAIFSFFLKGDPTSGAYLSVILGVFFVVVAYFVLKEIFSKYIALAISIILALSVGLITWDQNPWAPSLFYLSELLVFYGVYISNKKKYGLALVALGLAMGFQSHFAIFLLVLPIFIYLLIYKPVFEKKSIAVSLLIIIFSVLPVIIYDLTHGFINLQRLMSIFSLGTEGVAPAKIKLFTTLVSNSINIIWVDFPGYIKYIIFSLFILISFWGIFKDKKQRPLLILSNLFLFLPFFIFLFYKSSFSEYYLMTAVVPFLFILGYALSFIRSRLLVFILVGTIGILSIKSFTTITRPMNLFAKKLIVQEIVKRGGQGGYGVSISTRPGFNFGYGYIFDYYNSKPDIPPLRGQRKIFTIISPPKYDGIESFIEVDGIGLRWEGDVGF